jgi:hypothetical protein
MDVKIDDAKSGGEDDGGCMLLALNNCIPDVLSEEELNNEIESVYEEKNKLTEFFPDKYLIEWCGVPNKSWHQDCIPKALKKKYGVGGFVWKKQKNIDVIFKRNLGKFYVHGLLNRKLYSDRDGNWQHSICVNTNNGKFYDESIKGEKVKSWFEDNEDCYMKVWRVYKLELVKPKKVMKRKRIVVDNDELEE